MKYIFRYALLTQFTEKENLITKEQLLEALKSVKFSFNAKEIDSRQQTCGVYHFAPQNQR